MRCYRTGEIEQGHANPSDNWHSKESARQQVAHSREQIAASRDLLREVDPITELPQVRAMITHAECRALATAFKAKAAETNNSARTAAIMKNIARSLSGLASQLEMLTDHGPDRLRAASRRGGHDRHPSSGVAAIA